MSHDSKLEFNYGEQSRAILDLSFEQISVASIVVSVRSVAKITVHLTVKDDDGVQIIRCALEEGSKGTALGYNTGFFKHVIKNTFYRGDVFNSCQVCLEALPVGGKREEPACCSIMVRGAKNQLARGPELRDRT